ncbi:MAG: response regulator [Anaerolineales bacterium]|nr:response regulator [Anaerolineales bacterium]
MTDSEQQTINLQSLMERVLARLSDDPSGKPVALVAEFPAHIPPVAAHEKTAAAMIGAAVELALGWTRREEVRIQAQIVSTDKLPAQSEGKSESEQVDERIGFWTLISVSDQHAAFLPEADLRKGAPPTLDELRAMVSSLEVRAIEQGWRFWAESLDDEAIRLWLALPLQEGRREDTDITSVRETVDNRLQERGEGTARLLVQAVNDELYGMLIENFIEGGYDVVSTQVVGEVIPLARRQAPDLIILDLQSRRPTAMDLAVMIRQEPDLASTPILFLTEIAGPGIGRRMETVDFLLQPEGASAILDTVDQVLRSRLRPSARIMVVKTDDDVREDMIQTIQRQGYPVVEARSAEEALALAERVSVGVVLVESSLARGRDYWLVRQLRQLSKDIGIYLMSEGPASADAKQAMLRGATGYGDTGRLDDLLGKVRNDERDQSQEG